MYIIKLNTTPIAISWHTAIMQLIIAGEKSPKNQCGAVSFYSESTLDRMLIEVFSWISIYRQQISTKYQRAHEIEHVALYESVVNIWSSISLTHLNTY